MKEKNGEKNRWKFPKLHGKQYWGNKIKEPQIL